MKGYTPKAKCIKQLELSSKTEQFVMELGMKQKICSCEDCKKQKD